MSKTLTIKISDAVDKELRRVARETERAKSFHIQKALETYLEQYAEFQVALDRLNDQKDEIISSNEMRKVLGL